MVPSDARKSNLTVDGTLLVKGQIVVAKVQTGELSVISSNTARIKDAIVDDLTVVGTLLLPTAGGTASSLNFYQELDTSVTFTGVPLGTSQVVTAHLARVGKVVTMTLEGFTTTGNGLNGVLNGTAIPSQFRPVATYEVPMDVVDNNLNVVGFLNLDTSGALTIYRGVLNVDVLQRSTFSGLNNVGFATFTTSWIAA